MSQRGEENLLLPPPDEYEEFLRGLFPSQYPRPTVAVDTSTVRRYTDLDAPTTTPTTSSTDPPQPTIEAAMARERERQRRQMQDQMAYQARDPLNLEQDIRNAEALRREPTNHHISTPWHTSTAISLSPSSSIESRTAASPH